LTNGKIYVKNISKALAEVDPVNADAYGQAEAAYLGELDSLDTWVKAQFARIPEQKRRMITSHDAFGYLGDTYGVQILSPTGVSTASEPSAGGVKSRRACFFLKNQKQGVCP
jgi:zinc/manganese transport system substrate-binding protein